MTTWQDRVRQKMDEKGWNLNHLAIESRYSQSSLSRAMAGSGDLRANRLKDVADALGTTCDWLLHGIDENETKGRIPVFGLLCDLLQWRRGGIYDPPSEWVALPGSDDLLSPYAWRIDMEDLRPEIRPGDVLLMSQQLSAPSGSVVLYQVDTRPVCRILRKTATGDWLYSLDEREDPIAVDAKAGLLGVSVGIWRFCGIM